MMEQETVECKWCGGKTSATALKECPACWELKTRMENDPKIVEKILNEKVFQFTFKGKYLPGVAMVKAKSKKTAYKMLKARYPSIEPLEECSVKQKPFEVGILYFYDGDI